MNIRYAALAAVAALTVSASPSVAEIRYQTGGSMPVQSFTQCDVGPVYALNTRGARIRAGGYALHDLGNGQWERSYTNSVFEAKRRLVAPSYTYLDPNNVPGIAPCSN